MRSFVLSYVLIMGRLHVRFLSLGGFRPNKLFYDPVSVRLSITSRCSIKTADRVKLIFGTEASYPSAFHMLCLREFGYLQK